MFCKVPIRFSKFEYTTMNFAQLPPSIFVSVCVCVDYMQSPRK